MSFQKYSFVDDNIETFRTKMSKLQSPNRYSISFSNPKHEWLAVYPDSILLPEMAIATVAHSPWGHPTKIPVHGVCGDLIVSFIMLEDWSIRTYFEDWMNFTHNISEFGQPNAAPQAYQYSLGHAMISFYGSSDQYISQQYVINELYPTSVPPIEFASSSTGYNVFSVVFYVRSMANVTKDRSTTANITVRQNQSQ